MYYIRVYKYVYAFLHLFRRSVFLSAGDSRKVKEGHALENKKALLVPARPAHSGRACLRAVLCLGNRYRKQRKAADSSRTSALGFSGIQQGMA